MNKKDPKSRGWLLTLPETEYEQKFVEAKLERYTYIGQLECGENSGYRHWQILIEQPSSPIRFSTLKRLFPKGHIEARRGTVAEALAYVTKEETSLGVRISNGTITADEKTSKPSRLEELHARILAGESVNQILLDDPKAWFYGRNLERLANAVAVEKSKKLRDVEAVYLWGKTGVGKTRSLWERYGNKMYRVSDYSHPWDAYKGEKILVLDEFYSSNLPFNFLLNVLDRYPLDLPARYANKQANWEKVYLVSNVPLTSQYADVQRFNPNGWEALTRRIGEVKEMA